LAEKGVRLPLTARGNGTDATGAAIGEGIVMVFPAHMDKLLELDEREQKVRMQSGMNFKGLEDVLSTHGLRLPIFPLSHATSTIGGAIGNNVVGDRSIKYGSFRRFVDRLEVVLSNGELIETGRLSRGELSKKKALPGLEGEIYRGIDGLIDDNAELIKKVAAAPVKSNIGYAIGDVKHKDSSFDLTPLFVGAQGTLGVISQAIIRADNVTDTPTLVGVALNSIDDLEVAIAAIVTLEPSAFNFIDKSALEMIKKITGRTPGDVFGSEGADAAAILLVESDDNAARRKHNVKKMRGSLEKLGKVVVAETPEDQELLRMVLASTAAITSANYNHQVAVPIIDDATVPVENVAELLAKTKEIAKAKYINIAVWGRVGMGGLTVMPFVDLTKLEDRQKIINLMNKYYTEVANLGGVIAGQRGEGRLRSPFGDRQSGDKLSELYGKIKEIFDPEGILNPNVKVGTSVRELVEKFRSEYNTKRFNDHRPRA
jgi:FAD/FMN-containing dehydrogenase